MHTTEIINIAGLLISITGALVSAYFAMQSKKNADRLHELNQNDSLNQYVEAAVQQLSKHTVSAPIGPILIHYIESLGLSDEQAEEVWRRAYFRRTKRSPDETFREASCKALG
jgi:hypothetical protein